MRKYKLESLVEALEKVAESTNVKEKTANLSEKLDTPNISSNLGKLLKKLATQLRQDSNQEVTYSDVRNLFEALK